MEGLVIQADMEEISLPVSPSGTHPPPAIVPPPLCCMRTPPRTTAQPTITHTRHEQTKAQEASSARSQQRRAPAIPTRPLDQGTGVTRWCSLHRCMQSRPGARCPCSCHVDAMLMHRMSCSRRCRASSTQEPQADQDMQHQGMQRACRQHSTSGAAHAGTHEMEAHDVTAPRDHMAHA